MTRDGRFAALTNIREATRELPTAKSRGAIVTDFLSSSAKPADWLASEHASFDGYQGFNLLFGTVEHGLYFTRNGDGDGGAIASGIHGLSNGALNERWPKVQGLRRDLSNALSASVSLDADALLPLLTDDAQPADDLLPDTGVGLSVERLLAPRFIRSEDYGTRASSIIVIDRAGQIRFSEYRFGPGGVFDGVEHISWSL
jgi:uncharacterized protein with NRDE domain